MPAVTAKLCQPLLRSFSWLLERDLSESIQQPLCTALLTKHFLMYICLLLIVLTRKTQE